MPKALPTIKKVNEALLAEERVAFMDSFGEFFKAAWKASIEPHVPFDESPHYELLFEIAQLVGSGEFKKRFPEKDGVIVNIPPRSLKSMIFNVALPVWIWTHHPEKRFLCVSYGNDLAINFSLKRRDLIRSKWFKDHWPELHIKEDSDRVGKYDNDQTGYMICGSPGALATGFGANLVIIDDLLKADDAYSKASRESANRFYDSSLTSRRNNPAEDMYLIVCQRLHEGDIVGHLVKQDPKRWLVIEIPLEAEEEKVYEMPISGTKWRRKKGHVLLPKRFTKAFREGQKQRPRVWSGQYQQHPSPPGGFIFDPDRWGGGTFYTTPPDPELQIMSVDCAWKSGDENDYTAIHVYGVDGNRRYLMDWKTERMNYTQQLDNIRAMRKQYPKVSYVLVEEAANGYAVIKQLSEEMSGVIAIKPEGGKESRAVAASADMTHTFLPDPKKDPRVQALIDNFANFAGEGSIEHDDDIDAYTQCVNWLRQRFWGFSHVDKAYDEITKGRNATVEAGSPCPACDDPGVRITPDGWECSHCTSFVRGAKKRIVKAGF